MDGMDVCIFKTYLITMALSEIRTTLFSVADEMLIYLVLLAPVVGAVVALLCFSASQPNAPYAECTQLFVVFGFFFLALSESNRCIWPRLVSEFKAKM